MNLTESFILLCFFLSLLLLTVGLRGREPAWKAFLLIVLGGFAALFGARLFHVIWERPTFFLKHPELIFTQFDGMTFYGSVILCALTYYFFIPRLIHSKNRGRTWDLLSICAALGYGILRIDCFYKGCCWGKITALPWAVVYTESNAMPYIGLPVHPVQLYDSFHGFLVAAVLIVLYRKQKFQGSLIYLFFILYSLGRLFTEKFRGDRYRGTNLFLHLSTSQVISILLLAFGIFQLWSVLSPIHPPFTERKSSNEL